MASNTANNPSAKTSAELSRTPSGQKSGASSMSELMASYKSPFVVLHKGDTIKGKITKMSRVGIFVDINAKAEALVIEKERHLLHALRSMVSVGDIVDATVVSPESEIGTPIVSLRRFVEHKAWEQLEKLYKEGKQVDVSISELTKGGFLVTTQNGLSGFIPNSHTISTQAPQVGRMLAVFILDLNKRDNKIVFSQKTTMSDDMFVKATGKLKVGQKISTTVTNLTNFGIFVALPLETDASIQTIDGLIHISEISWQKVEDLSSLFSVGQAVEVVIIGIDTQAKRVDLSIKRLTIDPFEEISKKYQVDKKVAGVVSEISGTMVRVNLEDGVEGVIKKEKIPPNMELSVGKQLNVVVADIDLKRHRIHLVPVLLEKPIGYR